MAKSLVSVWVILGILTQVGLAEPSNTLLFLDTSLSTGLNPLVKSLEKHGFQPRHVFPNGVTVGFADSSAFHDLVRLPGVIFGRREIGEAIDIAPNDSAQPLMTEILTNFETLSSEPPDIEPIETTPSPLIEDALPSLKELNIQLPGLVPPYGASYATSSYMIGGG